MRVTKNLVRFKKILMYFRKYTADNLTFNVELANGDTDAGVDKLGEVHEVPYVVVIVAVDPPAGATGRRSKTPEEGALKTPVSK